MKKCLSCGFENPEEGKFCRKCGTKLEEKKFAKFCRFCGKQAAEGTKFCTGCGKSLELTEASPVVMPKQVQANKPAGAKKNVLPIVIIIVAAVLVVGLGIGAVCLLNSDLFDRDDSDEITSEEVKTEFDDENEREDESLNEEIQQDEADDTELSQNVDRSLPIPLNAAVSASSSIDNNLYAVSSICDGNAATSWAEGVAGYGVGEYLIANLDAEYMIYGMAVLPGYLVSVEEFNSCSYPVKFDVTAGGKTQTVEITQFNCDFNFSNNSYVYLDFAEPVKASEVKITIAGVYENVNSDATSIAELRLYTYPTEEEANYYSEESWKLDYVAVNVDYILPTINSEYLTMDDLEGLSAEQCRIARNELYARYGRRFLDESLQAYFDSKSWYRGTIEPDDFVDLEWLNEYEIANRDLIVEYETAKGYR